MQQINGEKNKEAWYQYIVLELVSSPHMLHTLLIKVISMSPMFCVLMGNT